MIRPTPRLQRELQTLHRMVDLYCRDHRHAHGPESTCTECREFLAYAGRRLEKCPYGERKPTCARCPIHCYKPPQREFARVVMRYAGPRMVLGHPWLSVLHVLDELRHVEHPMEARRRRLRSAGTTGTCWLQETHAAVPSRDDASVIDR